MVIALILTFYMLIVKQLLNRVNLIIWAIISIIITPWNTMWLKPAKGLFEISNLVLLLILHFATLDGAPV